MVKVTKIRTFNRPTKEQGKSHKRRNRVVTDKMSLCQSNEWKFGMWPNHD